MTKITKSSSKIGRRHFQTHGGRGLQEHKKTIKRMFLKEQETTAEWVRKSNGHHYHKTSDGDKALIKPSLASHVEIAPDPRNNSALAQARFIQGLGRQLMLSKTTRALAQTPSHYICPNTKT